MGFKKPLIFLLEKQAVAITGEMRRDSLDLLELSRFKLAASFLIRLSEPFHIGF